MAEYKIEGIAKEVRDYDSKFGPMKSYKLKLSGEMDPIELSQKAETPAPVIGSTLQGHIENTDFGKKFKKDFAGGGGGGFRGGGAKQDSYTMYLSYAKDLAVALIDKTGKLDEGAYGVLLDAVSNGGRTLYEARVEGDNKPEPKKEEPDKSDDPFDGMELLPEDE